MSWYSTASGGFRLLQLHAKSTNTSHTYNPKVKRKLLTATYKMDYKITSNTSEVYTSKQLAKNPRHLTRFTVPIQDMKILTLLSVLVLHLLLTFNCAAQTNGTPAWRGSIAVVVDGPEADPAIMNLESLIKRELRGLHDVDIAETNGDFILEIVCAQATVGPLPVYSLSVVFSQAADTSLAKFYAIPERTGALESYLSTLRENKFHQSIVCGRDDLQKKCENIVAHIDTQYFETERKNFHRTLKAVLASKAKSLPTSNTISASLNQR